MKSRKRVTLIGATGLIGNHLLEYLITDNNISDIHLLVRRPYQSDSAKVKTSVIDFSDMDAYKAAFQTCDITYCAIGTTNKKVAGDKEAYRKVDYDIPVNAAKFSLEVGCPTFALVSAIGANSHSKNFYQSLKGEVEEAIEQLSLPTFLIFRPSLLMGERKEFRFGEKAASRIMKPLSKLFPKAMRPIYAKDVALAMHRASTKGFSGKKIMQYTEMQDLILE